MDERPTKRPRGRPKAERARSAFFQVRAYPEWVAWLTAAAEQTGVDASDIVAQGVALWARRRKLAPPPER